jgi:hypothetical protein
MARYALCAGLPTVVVLLLLDAVTHYVVPAPRHEESWDLAMVSLPLVITAAWVADLCGLRLRLDTRSLRAPGRWLADFATLTTAVFGSLLLYAVIDGVPLRAAALAMCAASPVTALAPTLALTQPIWLRTTLVGLLALGVLGFFGRFSPAVADTVLAPRDSAARWLADGMACGASLLVALSFARSRS